MNCIARISRFASVVLVAITGCTGQPNTGHGEVPAQATAPIPDARVGKAFWSVPDVEPGPFLRPRFVSGMAPTRPAVPYLAERFVVLARQECGVATCYEVRFASGHVAYISAQDFAEAYDGNPAIGRLSEGGLITPDDPQLMTQRIADREARRVSAAQARAKGLGPFSRIYEDGLGIAPSQSTDQ